VSIRTIDGVKLHDDLSDVLQLAVSVLRAHGIADWKLTLVARNPDPDEPGQWVNVTNDEAALVAATITRARESAAPTPETR
jgi:hypothetical protein